MGTVDAAKAKFEVCNTELGLHTSRQDNETKKLEDLQERLKNATSGLVGQNHTFLVFLGPRKKSPE